MITLQICIIGQYKIHGEVIGVKEVILDLQVDMVD